MEDPPKGFTCGSTHSTTPRHGVSVMKSYYPGHYKTPHISDQGVDFMEDKRGPDVHVLLMVDGL